MIIHVVQRGEALWQLARRYGVPLERLIAANELDDPNRLAIGQAVVIPVPYRYHTVRAGETLWQIARAYGVTVEAIVQANRIANPALIYPGALLLIPARIHTVRTGETLGQIAAAYQVSVQQIIEFNPIADPNVITPGQRLVIPPAKPLIEVNAFTIDQGEKGAEQVREVGRHLTYAAPFAYTIRADGGLNPINDVAIIQAAFAARVVPMMTITNFTYQDPGSRLAQTILADATLQTRLLENIIQVMRAKGYRALNVDFENVYPSDRERYNAFLRRAAARLHAEGYWLSTSLAPKISAEQKGLLYEAHDYPAHGRIADFVVLMTYEWGYRFGPPQAISPVNQIRRVLDYAVTVIPREKIMMGFQIYARDWVLPHVPGQEAETFSPKEAVARAIRYGASIQYDAAAASPFYRYTDEQGRQHEVWFEDARSALAKFDLVKEYGLRGISYWVLGYPYPENWVLLEDNFRTRKRG
ncbi:spore gernimation protein [Geobacillus subterraneus]|uniref:Spore gernimation protein n=2 Tax=Geobacillus TaxID=129337 RepID=A0ABN4NFA4_9BACL|nr:MULTISPECIES: LysM peptidoglycan-binding domain-containing protein [Geobacillus]AMX82921.1 spore gernimation protein [Geobacillus subterraneus]KZS24901.1 spore gernimation protein [Geobacillus subterraneus]OXB91017.1 spore gernimation protein [Geobacillus uzenensis]QIZ68338.1 LysM peptidoglycan-binding domain-containing protein [Geobacillus subterraneus]